MSVENLANPANVLVKIGSAAPEECYLCGLPLSSPMVHWRCFGGALSLHPDCAKELGFKLMFDGERAAWITARKAPVSGIDASLIGGVADV